MKTKRHHFGIVFVLFYVMGRRPFLLNKDIVIVIGDLDIIFKVTARHNPPKLSQKVFVCMLSHRQLDGMLPNSQVYIHWTGSVAY